MTCRPEIRILLGAVTCISLLTTSCAFHLSLPPKSARLLPDLVITAVERTGNDLLVTVKNQGTTSVGTAWYLCYSSEAYLGGVQFVDAIPRCNTTMLACPDNDSS